MPDITMCVTDGCPLAQDCYRHPDSGTIPSFRQSWSVFIGGADCVDFWERVTTKAKPQQGGAEQ